MTQTTPHLPFVSRLKIRFSHTDAAGISFFGNVFKMAHDAYEDWLESLGFTWAEWFDNDAWAVPIRHSACEYFRPLRPGLECEIQILIEKIGETSLQMKYVFLVAGQKCCEVQLTHAFVSWETKTKTPIPSHVRQRLQVYQAQCLGTK
jgi:acyl-CoA thioesterase FadM